MILFFQAWLKAAYSKIVASRLAKSIGSSLARVGMWLHVELTEDKTEEFYRELDRDAMEHLTLTSKQLLIALQEKVSVPFPPWSQPGEPPALRSGAGKRAIRLKTAGKHISDEPEAYIEVEERGQHMVLLEEGMSSVHVILGDGRIWLPPPRDYIAHIEPRPWIEPVWQEEGQAFLAALLN